MLFIFLFYILIIRHKMKVDLKSAEGYTDYLSLEKTTSIKGIFIILVFFSHFNKYVSYENVLDIRYYQIIGIIGQIMVIPFFFYSGYGVIESIKKKGDKYVSSIPKNRILKVFVQFFIATIFLMLVKCAAGQEFALSEIILIFLAWENDWFVLAILFLYIFTYISFKLIKNKNMALNSTFVLLLTIAYIAVLMHFRPRYYYDTVLCYPLGMFWSLYKEKISALVKGKTHKWILLCAVLAFVALVFKMCGTYLPAVLLGYIFACAFIVIFTMRVSINNKIINWIGTHLFEIYLLHRIPMVICDGVGLIEFNPYISFIVCLAVTVLLAHFFKIVYTLLWKKIEKINIKN